jgi:hypothetical protein
MIGKLVRPPRGSSATGGDGGSSLGFVAELADLDVPSDDE